MKDLFIIFAVIAVAVLLPVVAKALGFGKARKSRAADVPTQTGKLIQQKSSYASK